MKDRSTSDKESLTGRKNPKLDKHSESFTNITHTSQRNYKSKQLTSIKHLNIDYFKLLPCNNTQPHNHKNCVNYHNTKDRKRPGNFYSETICRYIEQGKKCPQGDECLNAHSRVEQLYRADKYKIKFCAHYPNNVQKCEYGDLCSFAHSEAQINIQLIHNYEYDDDFYMQGQVQSRFHYKTVFCPLNLTQHDKALCVYAHNWQDYRRTPQSFYYQPIACPNWKPKEMIYDYSIEGCEHEFRCNMCHGWKELEYHPLNYRTKKCPNEKCKKGQCHYYHTEKERRIIDADLLSRQFRLVPRNRLVEGTYKYDYNTGFTARKVDTPSKSKDFSKDNSNPGSMFYISPTKTQQRKSNTTFKLSSITNHAIAQVTEKNQWIEGSKLHDSNSDQEESEDEEVKQHVDKLIQDSDNE